MAVKPRTDVMNDSVSLGDAIVMVTLWTPRTACAEVTPVASHGSR